MSGFLTEDKGIGKLDVDIEVLTLSASMTVYGTKIKSDIKYISIIV